VKWNKKKLIHKIHLQNSAAKFIREKVQQNAARFQQGEFSMAVEIDKCAGVLAVSKLHHQTNQSALYQTNG
jgi:hypothetical protein